MNRAKGDPNELEELGGVGASTCQREGQRAGRRVWEAGSSMA
jgi:hypothetical protein